MKDSLEGLEIGCRIGWLETYLTEGNVLAVKQVWGRVTEIKFHAGEIDGFSLAGIYARVTALDGRDLYIHMSHIDTIAKV